MWTGTGTLSFHPVGYHSKSNGRPTHDPWRLFPSLLLLLVSIAPTHRDWRTPRPSVFQVLIHSSVWQPSLVSNWRCDWIRETMGQVKSVFRSHFGSSLLAQAVSVQLSSNEHFKKVSFRCLGQCRGPRAANFPRFFLFYSPFFTFHLSILWFCVIILFRTFTNPSLFSFPRDHTLSAESLSYIVLWFCVIIQFRTFTTPCTFPSFLWR